MQIPENALRRLRDPKPRALTAIAVFAVVLSFVWFQHRSLATTRRSLQASASKLTRMKSDAHQIIELQSRPQRAVDREKPNAELLAQVEAALSESNIPRELWQDSIPQPTQRAKGSDYLRVATRLEFEGVTIRQIVVFTQALLQDDPTLSIQSLRVQNRTKRSGSIGGETTWSVEMTIGYFMYDLDGNDQKAQS